MGAMDWQETGLTHCQGNLWSQPHYHSDSPSEQETGNLGTLPTRGGYTVQGMKPKFRTHLFYDPLRLGVDGKCRVF